MKVGDNRFIIEAFIFDHSLNSGNNEGQSLLSNLTEEQRNSTYQERYDANFLATNFPAVQDNAGNAGSGWCGERIEAKAQQLANVIFWNWGLIDGLEDTSWCWTCELICWNNCSCKEKYRGLGYELNVFQARDLINCERIESLELLAEEEYQDASKRVRNAGFFGGSTSKNAKIDRRKWQIIKGWAFGVKGSADEGYYDTCAEEGLAQIYDEAAAKLQADIDRMNKPMSPLLIFGLITAGALGSILLINKLVK